MDNPTDKRTLNVLIAENSKSVVVRLAETLSKLECVGEVRTVGSQTEAYGAIEKFRPEVVLLDLVLKEGSGFGLLRDLRLVKHKPVIVIFSNFATPYYRELALSNGANYFLDKADFSTLPALLESLCN